MVQLYDHRLWLWRWAIRATKCSDIKRGPWQAHPLLHMSHFSQFMLFVLFAVLSAAWAAAFPANAPRSNDLTHAKRQSLFQTMLGIEQTQLYPGSNFELFGMYFTDGTHNIKIYLDDDSHPLDFPFGSEVTITDGQFSVEARIPESYDITNSVAHTLLVSFTDTSDTGSLQILVCGLAICHPRIGWVDTATFWVDTFTQQQFTESDQPQSVLLMLSNFPSGEVTFYVQSQCGGRILCLKPMTIGPFSVAADTSLLRFDLPTGLDIESTYYLFGQENIANLSNDLSFIIVPPP